jgi:hypothetical protein
VKLLDIAFTPQIFDPSHASSPQEWRDAIVQLTMMLFGGREVLPFVVCNFETEIDRWEWERLALVFIGQIAGKAPAREGAGPLDATEKGVRATKAPEKDPFGRQRGRCGSGPSRKVTGLTPFDGIVAHGRSPGANGEPVTPLAKAAEVMGEQLARIDAKACTSRSVADEIRVLFRYSQKIVMAMPYGRCQPFAVECLSHHLNPKQRSSVKSVDIHMKLGEGGSIEKAASQWRNELAKVCKDVAVTCHFWPHDDPPRERVILGCETRDIGDGPDKMRVVARWGVHLSHVPNEGNDGRKPPIAGERCSTIRTPRNIGDS